MFSSVSILSILLDNNIEQLLNINILHAIIHIIPQLWFLWYPKEACK